MNDTGPYQLPPADAAPARAVPRRGRPPTARFQPPSEPNREDPTAQSAEPATVTGVRLQRNRKRTEDKFHFPKKLVPKGWDYEWKSESVKGMPMADHINNLRDNHWSFVPQDRHPNYLVKKDGMILMERPKYLTDDARREDLEMALNQVESVRTGIQGTPSGTMPRRGTKVQTGYDMPIPDGGGDIGEQR